MKGYIHIPVVTFTGGDGPSPPMGPVDWILLGCMTCSIAGMIAYLAYA